MTDKIRPGTCCPYPEGENKCQSVYHSCANIVITGKIPAERYQHQNCQPSGPYTQQSDKWTFNERLKTWEIGNYTVRNTCPGFRPRNC